MQFYSNIGIITYKAFLCGDQKITVLTFFVFCKCLQYLQTKKTTK